MKDLHMFNNMDELQDKCTKLPDLQRTKIKMLLEGARTVYRKGERHNDEGDQELAYMCFMRYVEMYTCIVKKPDYEQHKQAVKQIFGGNRKLRETMDMLEVLSKSLTERYSRRHASASSSLSSAARPLAASSPAMIRTPAPPSKRIAPSYGDSDYELLSSSEKFDLLKAASASPPPHASAAAPPPAIGLMTCRELFEHLSANMVLVMDCRSSADYRLSHLTYQWAFNVPEEQITAGMSAGKLQARLDSESKAKWSARCVKEQIVLMDWNAKDSDPAPESSIAILRDILQNWDPDVTYRSPIKILDGGYGYFIMMYPTMCTNPSVQAPQQNNNNINLIDEIEYPSLHDITMKEDIRERGFSISPNRLSTTSRHHGGSAAATSSLRPSVDRSSKLAAVKTYHAKENLIVELQKEHEALINKAETNDEQLKLAQQRFQTMFADKAHVDNQNKMTNGEMELMYTLMQLESRAEDYKHENVRLRQELEEYKMNATDQKEQLSPKEAKSLEEAAKQIETKIQERQIIDEHNDIEREEREKQLEHMRQIKPSPSADSEESMSAASPTAFLPKIPQFDRSVKPQMPMTNAAVGPNIPSAAAIIGGGGSIDRVRDFSPTPGSMGRGLTGLKNLGNTCYMNSILQCLSNTDQLAEYCISERYKNYINRGNRTRGQIVEEVAALIKVLWTGAYRCVASKDLRYVVGQYQQIFRGVEQQDSHEFLTILMDWLHSDLQTLRVQEKLRDALTPSDHAWMEFTKAKESHILRLFYGQLKSTVKCEECLKESATYECFSSLSLELPANANDCYLGQCMDMYFSGERIHGWHCPTCKQKRPAIKTLGVSKLPPVLIIHLKRFYADTDTLGNSYKKKQNHVRFPLDNMDMLPYITKSEARTATPKAYQLYGVSNHYGSMEGGHYTAFCKSTQNGRWYKYDDQVVSAIDPSYVYSSAAYILFYARLPSQN